MHASAEPVVPVLAQQLEPRLTGGDAAARMAAIKEVANLAVKKVLVPADAAAILRIAPKVPAPGPGERDAQATLIDAVMMGATAEDVVVAQEIADGLRPAARERLLVVLASRELPNGAEALAAILKRHADEDHAPTWAVLEMHPRAGLGTALIAMIGVPGLHDRALAMTRRYCDRRLIAPGEIAASAGGLLRQYEETRSPEIVRILACLPKGPIDDVLAHALESEDPRIALAAADSLLAHRKKIASKTIERLAASDQTRAGLFELIGKRRMPKAWRTQDALARSLMVEWLADHGQSVAEIEPTGEIVVGPVVHHGFRFRTEPGGDWKIGVAGPFVLEDVPTTEDHGGTTSDLKPAGDRTPASLVDGREVRDDFLGEDPPLDAGK
jgi:hypothetical protein